MTTINIPKPTEILHLVDSEFLHVIKIDGRSMNLALTIAVKVNTSDNSTTITYSVTPWDNKFRKLIEKSFTTYQEAFDYYFEIFEKYK